MLLRQGGRPAGDLEFLGELFVGLLQGLGTRLLLFQHALARDGLVGRLRCGRRRRFRLGDLQLVGGLGRSRFVLDLGGDLALRRAAGRGRHRRRRGCSGLRETTAVSGKIRALCPDLAMSIGRVDRLGLSSRRNRQRTPGQHQVHVVVDECTRIGLNQCNQHLVQRNVGCVVVPGDLPERIAGLDFVTGGRLGGGRRNALRRL